MFFGAFTITTCNRYVGLSLPSIVADPAQIAAGFTPADGAVLLAVSNLMFVPGKLFLSLVADYLNAAHYFVAIMVVSGVMVIVFGVAQSFTWMIVCVAVTRLVQGAVWSTLLQISRQRFSTDRYVCAVSVISIGYLLGGVLAGMGVGGLLAVIHWSHVVVIVGCSMLLAALLGVCVIRTGRPPLECCPEWRARRREARRMHHAAPVHELQQKHAASQARDLDAGDGAIRAVRLARLMSTESGVDDGAAAPRGGGGLGDASPSIRVTLVPGGGDDSSGAPVPAPSPAPADASTLSPPPPPPPPHEGRVSFDTLTVRSTAIGMSVSGAHADAAPTPMLVPRVSAEAGVAALAYGLASDETARREREIVESLQWARLAAARDAATAAAAADSAAAVAEDDVEARLPAARGDAAGQPGAVAPSPSSADPAVADTSRAPAPAPAPRITFRQMMCNPRVWLQIMFLVCHTIAMEQDSNNPLLLSQVTGMAPSSASLVATTGPLGCTVGLLLYMAIRRWYTPEHAEWFAGLSTLFGVGGLLVTMLATVLVELRSVPLLAVTIFLGGVGSGVAFFVPPSLNVIRLGGPHNAGLLSGIGGGSGYITASAFNFMTSYLLSTAPTQAIVGAQWLVPSAVMLASLCASSVFLWLLTYKAIGAPPRPVRASCACAAARPS